MKITITGTPGTGKTSVSEIIHEKTGWPVIRANDLVHREYVDTRKLRMKALWAIKDMENAILEGHLFCEVKLPVDHVIVLRTRPDVLLERLKPRNYPEKKIQENVMAEMLDYCLSKAEKRYENVWQIDTTNRSPEETAEAILSAIKSGKPIREEVDWSGILEDWLRNGYIR